MERDDNKINPDIPFECDSYSGNGVNLSYLDSGTTKPALHLYHANGFPVSVYLPFMARLTEDFRVVGLGLRGQDAQAAGNTSWYQIARDLVGFLHCRQLGPVIGVGHSVGGVTTMLAAVERPNLFSKLILIDPVIHLYKNLFSMALRRITGRKHTYLPAVRARRRRSHWKDRDALYAYLQTKSLFKRFDDAYLRAYVTYGVVPAADGGVELLCPPEAEARIYESYPLNIWSKIKRLQVPTLIIRGEHSYILTETAVNRFCRKASEVKATTIKDAGHLIPMEKPDELLDLIKDFAG